MHRWRKRPLFVGGKTHNTHTHVSVWCRWAPESAENGCTWMHALQSHLTNINISPSQTFCSEICHPDWRRGEAEERVEISNDTPLVYFYLKISAELVNYWFKPGQNRFYDLLKTRHIIPCLDIAHHVSEFIIHGNAWKHFCSSERHHSILLVLVSMREEYRSEMTDAKTFPFFFCRWSAIIFISASHVWQWSE